MGTSGPRELSGSYEHTSLETASAIRQPPAPLDPTASPQTHIQAPHVSQEVPREPTSLCEAHSTSGGRSTGSGPSSLPH